MTIKPIDYDNIPVDTKAITSDITNSTEPEVAVPSEVIKAIDDQIKQLENDIEEDGGTAIQTDSQLLSNQQEILRDIISKLEMIKKELAKGTLDGVKRAQIAWAQIPNFMWKYVPTVVSQYIYSTKANKGTSLISAFYNNKPFKEQK